MEGLDLCPECGRLMWVRTGQHTHSGKLICDIAIAPVNVEQIEEVDCDIPD